MRAETRRRDGRNSSTLSPNTSTAVRRISDSKVSAKVTYAHHDCFAGHAKHFHYDLTVTTPGGDFTFPLRLSYPKSDKKVPLIVSISFDPLIPSGFTPDEEICSKGVALAKFVYTDVAADRYDDCKEEWRRSSPRKEGASDLWGKIGMWAWAASRALDFLLTLDLFDPERIAVEGHSRLGKTALWCGAQDTRFRYVFSNNAGCSGDAITRGKKGEDIGYHHEDLRLLVLRPVQGLCRRRNRKDAVRSALAHRGFSAETRRRRRVLS